MSTADALMLSVQTGGTAESPFEAGQQIAREVLKSVALQLGGVTWLRSWPGCSLAR